MIDNETHRGSASVVERTDKEPPDQPRNTPAGRSPAAIMVRRFFRKRTAVIGLVIFVVILLSALLAPLISPYEYYVQDWRNRLDAPSAQHWFGTDQHGRDVLSRILWGGRVSFQIVAVGVVGALAIGAVLGGTAGFFGGKIDTVIMRTVDVFMAFPAFFLALLLVGVFRPGVQMTSIAIMATFWVVPARLTRAEFLSLREREFVLAARVLGYGNTRVMFRHIMPNSIAPLLVQGTLACGYAVMTEAGLSFLGLGAQPPVPSWGNILSVGRDYLTVAPWIATFPGFFIFLTVLSLNFIGDGLRDAIDPFSN